MLGQAGKVYYDDGIAGNIGDEDYGGDLGSPIRTRTPSVWPECNPSYELHPSFGDRPDGTSLYTSTQRTTTELVGVLAGVSGLTLSSDVFVFNSLVA